jgi:hypothetical protein
MNQHLRAHEKAAWMLRPSLQQQVLLMTRLTVRIACG